MPRKSRILIIEDDEYSIEAYANLLKAEGYEPECAHDGESGLEKAQQSAPDVILLDLGLPGITGRDLIRTIRGSETLRSTPILVITGRENDEAESAVSLGADAYLIKPVEFGDLLRALTALNVPAPEA